MHFILYSLLICHPYWNSIGGSSINRCCFCWPFRLSLSFRYDCLSCDNFTLCSKCLTSVKHPHQLTRRRVPKHCKPPKEYRNPVGHSEFGRVLATETDDKQRAIVQKIVDDYYALDFEDIIGGDLPTRFKYASVPPADYGLSIDHILSK